MTNKNQVLSLLFFFLTFSIFSQDVSNNRLKVETEPALFFNNGRSLNILYNVLPNNDLGFGMYVLTSDVPNTIAAGMFSNYNDSSLCRVTQEFAVSGRYILRFWKNIESNPYVGFISGWENFKITRPGYKDLNVETFFFTPHVGYELYVYKKIVFLNTQIRVPFYFASNKSDDNRPEKINAFTILPAISFGARF